MFPYNGKSILNPSADPAVSQLQQAHREVEDVVLAMVHPDLNISMIAHLDNSLVAHNGMSGTSNGHIRYLPGRYQDSSGVAIEQEGSNLVPNPSAEIDTTGWAVSDASVSLSRSMQGYNQGVTSAASFSLAGSGNAGGSYMSSSVAVNGGTAYSASVYVYAPPGTSSKAKLELAFSGGTPVSYNSGDVALNPGGWQRLTLEDKNSNDNTTCEIRIRITQQAPAYTPGSRLSTLTPTATAAVTDAAMTINAGDIAMCAVTANPSGPNKYAFHMVTTGATGVSGAALRLDNQAAKPTYVAGSIFSKLAPAGGDSVLVTDTGLVLSVGDQVFCNLGDGYDWHIVTTGATGVSASALRLDDMPAAPTFAGGSRFTRIVPDDTAAVTDNSMTIGLGDLVYCRTIANPASSAYGWHVVTAAATGVNSASLRLDGSSAAPSYAGGSWFSLLTAAATGNDVDNSATLTTGDLAFAAPTKNASGVTQGQLGPSASYGWHTVTTGATGVASSSLRLDQTTTESILADAVQLEPRSTASTYIDSLQGPGYSGAIGSISERAGGTVSFPTSGVINGSEGFIAFHMFPTWAGDDGKEHVLFDMAIGAEQNRLLFAKRADNKLALSVYDGNGQLKQAVTSSTVSFAAWAWVHLTFSWNSGTLAIYLDGASQSLSSSGSGSGELGTLPASFMLGSDYQGNIDTGALFDDLVAGHAFIDATIFQQMAADIAPFLGLASARKGIDSAAGTGVTHASAGTQVTISHNLGVTPKFVHITPRGNGVVYLSAASDDGFFYVKGSASSITFDWLALA